MPRDFPTDMYAAAERATPGKTPAGSTSSILPQKPWVYQIFRWVFPETPGAKGRFAKEKIENCKKQGVKTDVLAGRICENRMRKQGVISPNSPKKGYKTEINRGKTR